MKMRALMGVAALAMTAGMAQGQTFAFTVEDVDQGQSNTGGSIAHTRSDPLSALGAPQGLGVGTFFSLGFGGHLTLAFNGPFGGSVTIWECTQGNIAEYPETAEIYVGWGASAATATYQLVGSTLNLNSPETFDLTATNLLTGRTSYDFVKILDTSNPNAVPKGADGYDVDAVAVGPIPAPGTIALLAAAGLVGTRRRRA